MIKNFLEWSIKTGGLYLIAMLPVVLIVPLLAENPEHMREIAIGMYIGGAIGCGFGNGLAAAIRLR